jgi:hypothetical protein
MRATCSLCDREVVARGWCEHHYRRWKRTGDPTYSERESPFNQPLVRLMMWADLGENEDDCWVWQGKSVTKDGYGLISFQDGNVLVHRLMYELVVGPLIDDMEIDHTCFNRLCIKPAHLEQVTRSVNAQRRSARNRKIWCDIHEEPWVTTAGGWRYCRSCNAQKARDLRAKRRRD